ncbi:zinc finger protein hunchback [Lycorma delicatula]|uniref:zinc finger protein hunchback n=1 Tax=Lycorma delicatula TaxID=130591 RepID=UPI003F5191E3
MDRYITSTFWQEMDLNSENNITRTNDMVVNSNETLSDTCKEEMNSTCALGPTQRHKLFGGGILNINPWHQTKEESMQEKEENTNLVDKNTNSPTYSASRECNKSTLPNTVYNTLHHHHHNHHNTSLCQINQNQLQIKEESSNNNSTEEDNLSQLDTNSVSDIQNQRQGTDDSQSSTYSTGSDNGSIRPPSNGPTYLPDGLVDDPLRRLQMALQRTGMMGTPPPNKSSVIIPNHHHNSEKPLQCPICTFSTTSRVNFNTHLQSHEDQRSCSMCEFAAESTNQFKEHMRDAHDVILAGNADDDALDEEEPGLAVPKVNSQGKVKTFRCKQCDFSAVTKLEFWQHTRSHIKQERLLTCPKCPFVTEYKHHLEYHLRNHFGSKPFKCDKCIYSCVNKSMLNSHLKSHSNIYQYRCSDCTYATKYCHSLKLHLRKYGHTPAMVLNPDGSPNPLPIVDVYGTRRGPKQRMTKMTITDENNSQSGNGGSGLSSIHSLFAPPYIPYYSPLLHPLMYQTGNSVLPQDSSNPKTSQQQDRQSGNNFYETKNNHLHNSMNDNSSEQFNEETMENESIPECEEEKTTEFDQPCRAPLDLSRSDSQEENKSIRNNSLSVKTHAGIHDNGSVKVNERRRKGKAFRLDTIALRLQQQNSSSGEEEFDCEPPLLKKPHIEQNYIEENNNNNNNNHSNGSTNEGELPLQCVLDEEEDYDDDDQKKNEHPNSLSPSTSSSSSSSSSSSLINKTKSSAVTDTSYTCSYCDITFKDIIMYEMHKGYHGFQDPFKCNMCGQQTTDKVSFFLHIARISHS